MCPFYSSAGCPSQQARQRLPSQRKHTHTHTHIRLASNSLKYKEQSTCGENEAHGEGQDPALAGHDDPTVAVEAVLPGENFPLSPGPPGLFPPLGAIVRRRGRRGQRQRVNLLILAGFHGRRCALGARRRRPDADTCPAADSIAADPPRARGGGGGGGGRAAQMSSSHTANMPIFHHVNNPRSPCLQPRSGCSPYPYAYSPPGPFLFVCLFLGFFQDMARIEAVSLLAVRSTLAN